MSKLTVQRLFILITLIFVPLSGPVSAQFTIDESALPGGDFNDSSPGGNVGFIGAGQNIAIGGLDGFCMDISGGMPPEFDCNSQSVGDDEQDSFNFDVAPGFSITSIILETLTGSGPAGFGTSFFARDVDNNNVIGTAFGLPASGGNSANVLSMSLDEGRYAVSVFGGRADEEGAYALDYRVTITAIPEPASLAWLWVAALAGWFRRLR